MQSGNQICIPESGKTNIDLLAPKPELQSLIKVSIIMSNRPLIQF
jgi:hypothetical protein